MTSRTSPTEAIERLSWILNYVDEEPQSLNSLANRSDLSWATVQKYLKTIEAVQKIAPPVTTQSSGTETEGRSRLVSDLTKDPVTALTVYLFAQAEMREGVGAPISRDLCEGLHDDFNGALQQAIELGWIEEVDEHHIRLTPMGIRVAGPAKSEVENTKNPILTENLRIHHCGSETVISLADEPEGSETGPKPDQRKYPDDRYDDESDTETRGDTKVLAAA